MIKTDTIQTYIFKPNYYKNDKIAIYWNILKLEMKMNVSIINRIL